MAGIHGGRELSKVPPVKVADFYYDLSEDRIASRGLEDRSSAKLLHFDAQRKICHLTFKEVSTLVQPGDVWVFNNTKVIPARLMAKTQHGGEVEVFLLRKLSEGLEVWEALVGGKKKWKEGETLRVKDAAGEDRLVLKWEEREQNWVHLTAVGTADIAMAIEESGKVPLPPYIKRAQEEQDRERYQSVMAKKKGAVAAPTASLHFTQESVAQLKAAGAEIIEVTLHVGAGTFMPVKSETADGHEMHTEDFEVSIGAVIALRKAVQEGRRVVAVGTTALRLLESLYYIGEQIAEKGEEAWSVGSGEGYVAGKMEMSESLEKIEQWMRGEGREEKRGFTQIFIVPGYRFKVVGGLITNFHQPGSTLLMLISGFIGGGWEEIYGEAKAKGYRFLSYGDGSMLEGGVVNR